MDRSRVQFYRRETSFLRSKTETTTLAWACEVDWVQLGAIVETCGILAPVHNVVQRCHQEPSSYLKKLPTEVLNMVISELHNLEYDLKLQEWVQTLRCCQRECDIYYHYLGQELEEVQSIRDKWRKENVESGRNHVLLCGPEYETMHDDCCRAVQNLLRDKVLGRNPSFNADREHFREHYALEATIVLLHKEKLGEKTTWGRVCNGRYLRDEVRAYIGLPILRGKRYTNHEIRQLGVTLATPHDQAQAEQENGKQVKTIKDAAVSAVKRFSRTRKDDTDFFLSSSNSSNEASSTGNVELVVFGSGPRLEPSGSWCPDDARVWLHHEATTVPDYFDHDYESE